MLRLKLRTKLLLGLLLILAPILGLLLYGFQSQYGRQREDVLASQTRLGQTIAVLADSSFDEALALARALADDPVVQSLDPSTLDPYLQRLGRFRPEYENLGAVNAAGDLMGSAVLPPGPRPSAVGRRYFEQVMATGAPALSEVILSRVTSRPTVAAAAPLPGSGGRPAGVSIVSFYLDDLARSLESVGLRPGQAIFLADRTGRLAFHTARPDLAWEARDISGWPEVRAALAGQTLQISEFRSPLLGDVRTTVFVPTPRQGWVVGVSLPVAEAFGPLEAANRIQLLVFGPIALASVLGFVAFARFLTAPLRELTDLAQALGRGELRRRAAVQTGDELQLLGETFNTMASKLEDSVGQLHATIAELTTPVLILREGLLFLPIIGAVDSARVREITEGLLTAIRAHRARAVVMDITGVPAVDSAVAGHLVQTVEAARLMGASAIVTGLSPEIAQTLARLGLDLRRLRTVGDLQSGIEAAERLMMGEDT